MSGYISGEVTVSGVLSPNTTVRLYYNIDGSLLSQLTTTVSGSFIFDNLVAGANYYTVTAYKDSYNAIIFDNITALDH